MRAALWRGVLAAIIAVAGLSVAHVARADPPISDQDLWCLTPSNQGHVISTAQILGLGQPSGPGHRQITPHASEQVLRLSVWREQRPADFNQACVRAYILYSRQGIASEVDANDERIAAEVEAKSAGEIASLNHAITSIKPPDLSTAEEAGISVGGGVLAALAGIVAGAFVTKRSQDDERSYRGAAELGNELIVLSVELDLLSEKARSESAEASDYEAVRKLALRLLSILPASATRDAAANSVRGLVTALDAAVLADPEAQASRLEAAGARVVAAVGAVIVDLHKKAAAPPNLAQEIGGAGTTG